MSATLKQIAEHTGLSIPTVHQILNGYNARFSADTRARVLEAAKKLDYRPNIAARGLRAKKTFLLGLQFNSVNHPLIAGFTRGFQAVSRAAGYAPVFLTHSDVAEEQENLRTLMDRKVDGLIVNLAVDPDGKTNVQALEGLAGNTPVVEAFGRFVNGVPKVTLDYRHAARVATEHLLSQGHRRIALVTHESYRESERVPGLYWTAWEHWQGYREAIAKAGEEELIVTYPVRVDRTREGAHFFGAYGIASSLLKHPARPTAAVCYRAEAAEALIQYTTAHPTEAPARFGIAVFENVRPFVSKSMELTVLPLPTEAVGQAAARLLLERINGEHPDSVAMGPDAVNTIVNHKP